MSKSKIDELNILSEEEVFRQEIQKTQGGKKSPNEFDYKEFIDNYFEPMELTEEQKEERKEAAYDLFDKFLFFFTFMALSPESYELALQQFEFELRTIAIQYSRADDYIDKYVPKVAQNVAETTKKNIGKEYYTSVERAAFDAVNEANGLLNYEELQEAIEAGYTHKTWVAEIDKRTRDSHRQIDGTTIPIEEYFQFDDCEMLMAHDEENGTAAQCVNCRCTTRFG